MSRAQKTYLAPILPPGLLVYSIILAESCAVVPLFFVPISLEVGQI